VRIASASALGALRGHLANRRAADVAVAGGFRRRAIRGRRGAFGRVAIRGTRGALGGDVATRCAGGAFGGHLAGEVRGAGDVVGPEAHAALRLGRGRA